MELVDSTTELPGFPSYRKIRITQPRYAKLDITLRRTIRVPDNGDCFNLPPDMGAFPIFNVEQYRSSLPKSLVEKGGVFVPIYRKL